MHSTVARRSICPNIYSRLFSRLEYSPYYSIGCGGFLGGIWNYYWKRVHQRSWSLWYQCISIKISFCNLRIYVCRYNYCYSGRYLVFAP